MSQPDLQPTLTGPTVIVRPIAAADWNELFAAASDPEIWKVHPRSDRYTEPEFRIFFDSAVEFEDGLRVRRPRDRPADRLQPLLRL